jgi:hypothetical protein
VVQPANAQNDKSAPLDEIVSLTQHLIRFKTMHSRMEEITA